MTARQREQFAKRLRAERSRLEESLSRLASASAGSPEDRGRLGDTAASSISGPSLDDDRAVVAHTSRELEEIDRALALLRDDPSRYGICSTCGGAIPLERLRLVPGTRHCQVHAPA